MTTRKTCPECASDNLYVRGDIATRGGYGPDLLPGVSGVFTTAKMKAVVCKDCGLVRFFAAKDSLSRIGSDRGWNKLI